MRVLVIIENSPRQGFLVRLPRENLIKDIKSLITRKKHSTAIMKALTEGVIEKTIPDREEGSIKVDLILTTSGAHWDLT